MLLTFRIDRSADKEHVPLAGSLISDAFENHESTAIPGSSIAYLGPFL
jgi:hypothetical protein